MANKTLVAAAGEHFVAYALSCRGFTAALVRQGAPSIDILASSLSGDKAVGIQVKTTEWAQRTRGRGDEKKLFELQFPLGHRAIEEASPNTIVCFVDLKGLDGVKMPDVYVVPTTVLIEQHEGVNIRRYSFFRYHRRVEEMERFKNNWHPVVQALAVGPRNNGPTSSGQHLTDCEEQEARHSQQATSDGPRATGSERNEIS